MKNPLRIKNVLQQDPREPEFVQNPYALYRQLHVTGEPVYWQNYEFWCLPSFELVNNVLRDKRFARLPPPGHELASLPSHLADFEVVEKHSLLALEPPDHTRLRKAVNRAFINRQVSQMIPAIRKLANRCIDTLSGGGRCNLLTQYATPIPVAVIIQLLGVPESAGKNLVRWSHDMVRVYTMTQSRDEELTANQAAKEFQAFVVELIEQKRAAPADDLISHLLDTKNNEQILSDPEIVSIVILLLNAGHEATVHQLGNAVNTLLEHYPLTERESLLKILADDDKADALVNECLRHAAPLHLFIRYAQEPVTLSENVALRTGERVGLLLAAANRCPRRFKQAEKFLPGRDDGGHVSLGAGIHFCVGAHLAKLELRIALQALFERLPDLQLDARVQYQDAYHFHGLQELPVRWGVGPD